MSILRTQVLIHLCLNVSIKIIDTFGNDSATCIRSVLFDCLLSSSLQTFCEKMLSLNYITIIVTDIWGKSRNESVPQVPPFCYVLLLPIFVLDIVGEHPESFNRFILRHHMACTLEKSKQKSEFCGNSSFFCTIKANL